MPGKSKLYTTDPDGLHRGRGLYYLRNSRDKRKKFSKRIHELDAVRRNPLTGDSSAKSRRTSGHLNDGKTLKGGGRI